MYRCVVAICCFVWFVLSSSMFAQHDDNFTWPNGAKAAICLTYDDGLPSHINTVAPLLDDYGFTATFYVTLNSPSLYENMEQWKALSKRGHELGNHSVYHPCQKSLPNMDWVKSYYDLDTYSVEQMHSEIQLANSFLKSLDGHDAHSYAYPCSQLLAGGKSYKDSIDVYVSAARGGEVNFDNLLSPNTMDIYNVPSWAPNELDGDALIEYVQAVSNKKTLGVFTFHGVGAEYLTTSNKAHEALLAYLDKHRDEIWITTFKEATEYIKQHR